NQKCLQCSISQEERMKLPECVSHRAARQIASGSVEGQRRRLGILSKSSSNPRELSSRASCQTLSLGDDRPRHGAQSATRPDYRRTEPCSGSDGPALPPCAPLTRGRGRAAPG